MESNMQTTQQQALPGSSPVERDARFSDCGTYRYNLTRLWDARLIRVCWVMLNPSTADQHEDDATIRRCIGFSRSWGAGALTVVNLFAFRATQPRDLWAAAAR